MSCKRTKTVTVLYVAPVIIMGPLLPRRAETLPRVLSFLHTHPYCDTNDPDAFPPIGCRTVAVVQAHATILNGREVQSALSKFYFLHRVLFQNPFSFS